MRKLGVTHALFRRFGADKSGAVGVIFGLSVIPMMGLAGAAVDYGRASAARAGMQAAVDAAALSLAKDGPSMTMPQAIAHGTTVFNANWVNRHGGSAPTVTVTRGTDTYRVTARASVNMVLMPLFGFSTTDIAVEAVSAGASTRSRSRSCSTTPAPWAGRTRCRS